MPLVVHVRPGKVADDDGMIGEEKLIDLKCDGKPYEVAGKVVKAHTTTSRTSWTMSSAS